MSKKEPTANFETITPQMAKKWLEKNPNNRNLSQRSLNHYIRQIEEGQWVTNGDAIRFQDNDNLMDGQHRLEAIVHTGKPMKCLIVRGLPKEAMPTIDTGRGRTVADHLKLQHKYNVNSYTATAAAIGIIWRFRNGIYVDTKERLTPAEAIAFIEQNPGILKSAELNANKDLTRILMPSISISTHYLFSRIDKFKCQEFFDRLTAGHDLGKTSPILKLRTEMLGMRSSEKRRGAINQRTFLYYTISAFDAFLHGRRIDGFEKMTAKTVIELPKRSRGG